MKYPLIYSLSTAGILKHYNQDYLIHQERTDFTGANGVGKSIIADLFQLIFVNDRNLFQFGTEGYKKEIRQLDKLPYGCRDAYAFLTIELEAGRFITIGVCIPNSNSRPLKPFLITTDPDNDRPLKERAFGPEQVPTSRSFINPQNKISIIEDVAKRFRDEYGLFFEHYSTRELKDAHYGRLYDQQLLPINLSVPSSHKAFAKIIQSFSRARTGAENKSEELKDFLFDGAEKEFEQSFDQHKGEIDKLLKDYEALQVFILDLEAKQAQLEELHNLLILQQEAEKAYLVGNVGYALTQLQKARLLSDQKIADYKDIVDKAGALAVQLPKLGRLATGYEALRSGANDQLAAIRQCRELNDRIKNLDARITSFTLDDLPVVNELPKAEVSIDHYDDRELIRRLQFFSPVYRDYGSVAAIYQQIDAQKEMIRARRRELDEQVRHLELLLKLLSGTDQSSLLSRVLQSDRVISPAQEAVLFHLLNTYWGKPEVLGFPYYASGFDFFNEGQLVPAEPLGGYWLQLNDLHMYIPALQQPAILADPRLRKTAISALLAEQETTLERVRSELLQLQLFEKGQEFIADRSTLFDAMDARLYDYAIAEQLGLTAQLAMQLDGKTERLKTEREELRDEFMLKLTTAGIASAADLAGLEQQQQTNLETWQARNVYYSKRLTSDTATEKAWRENTIPALQQQAEEKKVAADRCALNHMERRMTLEAAYPEMLTAIVAEITELETTRFKKNFDEARLGYQSFFLSVMERFRETKNGANAEVSSELARQHYNFDLLERALLGNRIRFRDQIAEELRTANRSRHKLVDSIYETMLKIFMKTKAKYEEYRALIRDLNLFFIGKKISNKYFFQVNFVANTDIPIDWINQLQGQSQQLYKSGELPLGESVEDFVADFFKAAVQYKGKIAFRDLLDPRTYFTLDAGLADENGKETAGSTGETYTAKVLLGIGRLSKVQSQNRPGIRFMILEETANLDTTNFSNFPAIAEEFGYQIITMTPKPFGSASATGWYLHHLLPGKIDTDINYPVPASYFKTNTGSEDLRAYLNRMKE